MGAISNLQEFSVGNSHWTLFDQNPKMSILNVALCLVSEHINYLAFALKVLLSYNHVCFQKN